MNYEEMLNARDGVATHREDMPFGVFYRKLIDKKYRNVVELRPELTDSIIFCEGLRSDIKFIDSFTCPEQLHFKANEDSNGIYELELEPGNFQTMGQLLTQNPAIVAQNGYVDKVIAQVADMLMKLHKENVYQLCLAPNNIFIRKNDNMPLLLCHGSFFKAMTNRRELWKGFEDSIAPEVLEGAEPDACSDVYAFGKFIKLLLADGSMDYEYKAVVKKAVAADPAERFPNVETMMAEVTKKRSMKHSVIAMVAAIAIALICVALYFEMMPETVDVEFVKPVKEEVFDPYDVSLTPGELGYDDEDSLYMTEQQRHELSEMQAEVERIFQRQFTNDANRALSKIYSKDKMNATEQAFVATSNEIMEDLLRRRDALAKQAGIEPEKAQKIADDIIEKIRREKKKKLKSYGFQKPGSDDE